MIILLVGDYWQFCFHYFRKKVGTKFYKFKNKPLQIVPWVKFPEMIRYRRMTFCLLVFARNQQKTFILTTKREK